MADPGAAQQATMPVIGFLDSRSSEGMASRLAAFRQGLKEVGLVVNLKTAKALVTVTSPPIMRASLRVMARSSVGHEEVDFETNQLGREFSQSYVISFGPAEVDENVVAIKVAEVARPSQLFQSGFGLRSNARDFNISVPGRSANTTPNEAVRM